jgi:hypothetical protein
VQWLPIPLRGEPELDQAAIRLNSLGSLAFFISFTLKRNKLSRLHDKICRSLEREHLRLVLELPRWHYKALDLDTRIPTPSGFTTMRDVKVGDTVFDSSGRQTLVSGVSPIYLSEKCYEVVFSSGERVIADAGHLWVTSTRRDRDRMKHKKVSDVYTVKTTQQIAESVSHFHQISMFSSKDNPCFRLPRKVARLVERPKKEKRHSIVSVTEVPNRPVKCIMVDSETQMFLVTDGFIPTHNTTIVAEGLPMWWALPFTPMDEELMRCAGYDDAWIRWMRHAHDRDTSTLLIAETEKNTVLNGTLIDHHYQNNDLFRWIFPEIIPDGTTTWNNEIKIHRRSPHVAEIRKEGTYHYRGVGQAVTGLHPARAIEDDLFGLEAQQSEAVAEATIRYHRMLGGVIGDGDNVVDGNRWSVADLDGWIRENDKTFAVESHSAEGGCCDEHPEGIALFPEEWPLEKLHYQRLRMGDYDYEHQFLNRPTIAGDIVFDKAWLREFRYKASDPKLPPDDPMNFLFIEHEVVNGKVLEDIPAGVLQMRMVIDPNHAGKKGRCKHAITVTGLDTDTDNLYLIDEWAASVQFSDLIGQIYKMARHWNLQECWLETVAAQKYLKFYLDERNLIESRPIRFNELPNDNRANAKDRRIEALEPVFRNGTFWHLTPEQYVAVDHSHGQFRKEYLSYYRGKQVDVDVLDTLGFVPQLFENVRRRKSISVIRQRASEFKERNVGVTGY